MEQLNVILLILMILGSNPEGQPTIETLTSAKVCETQEQCRALELACDRAGYDAVERVYRNTGKEQAQFLCAKINLHNNN